MTHRSPLVTLMGLVAAFAIMFGVNLASSAPRGSYAGGASPSAAPSAPPAATAEPTPTPTPAATATATQKGSDFPEKVVYTGHTDDKSTAIAVAILGTRAAAYLCDGSSVEAWLRGTVDGDEITLTGKNGARLEAELDDDTLEGTVEVNDEKSKFAIGVAKRPAGLYRAKGSKTTIGWIVLPDGSQVGIQTTGEESSPAPELDPANPEVIVDGEQLAAEVVSGDEDI